MNNLQIRRLRIQKSALLLALGSMGLAGCAGSGSNGPTGPGVRAVNGLNTLGEAVILDGTNVVSPELPYGSGSGTPHNPYSIVPLGSQTVTVANFNTPNTVVDSSTINVANVGLHLDMIAYNPTAPTFLTLIDNFAVPTNCNIRFANASTAAGTVDVILTPPTGSGSSLKFTLAPGQVGPAQPAGNFAYQTFTTSGAYILQVFPAGQDSGTPLINETITLPYSASFTYILLDPMTAGSGEEMLEVQDNQLYDSAP